MDGAQGAVSCGTELLVDRRERFEIWTLNRPERKNALSRGLVESLHDHVARVQDERTVCAVVLTGAGDGFCAGADLKEREGMSEAEVRGFLGRLRSALRSLETCERVFIAAINGPAFGGGTELALACDLRVVDEAAMMGLTEVTLGIIPGGGGTQRLSRLIGPGRAKELIFTGRRVSGREAFALGLVNQVATAAGSVADAVALAERIGRNAPIALAASKRAIQEGLDGSLDEGLEIEQRQYERTLATRDRLEGLSAFREKRPPRFTGE
jgi:enoyl-CoA hydratase/carnithine racemase